MEFRILLASDFYQPFIGGTERQVQLLGWELAERGHEISVATIWHAGLLERQDDSGIAVFRLKGQLTRPPFFFKNPERRFHPPFPEPGVVRGLRLLIRRLRPDVIHAFGWIAYSCAAALRGTTIPLVVSLQDYGYSCATRTLLHFDRICDGPAFMKCLRCAARTYGAAKATAAVAGSFASRGLLIRRTSVFNGISTYVRDIAERDLLAGRAHASGSTVVMPPVVLPGSEHSSDRGGPTENHADCLPTEPYILFVGALKAQKGIWTLLAAYERLASPPPLVLIGTVWPDTPQKFPAGVTVLHDFSYNSVMVAWEQCLFAVVPSVWPEPFGNVITEAMSKSKAVIATNVGGPVDIVIDAETGLLTPPGDVEALAAAMIRLIDDPYFRERLGKAGKERMKRFAVDRTISRYEALYRQLVESTSEMP